MRACLRGRGRWDRASRAASSTKLCCIYACCHARPRPRRRRPAVEMAPWRRLDAGGQPHDHGFVMQGTEASGAWAGLARRGCWCYPGCPRHMPRAAPLTCLPVAPQTRTAYVTVDNKGKVEVTGGLKDLKARSIAVGCAVGWRGGSVGASALCRATHPSRLPPCTL